MPPIKVHIDDPLTPKSQQSNEAPKATESQPDSSPYPPAAPGAAAFPAPTSFARPQPPPTRTTVPPSHDPPPPQPGAVPVPFSQTAVTLPPPPKAGDIPQKQGPVTAMPPQMDVPPPQQNYTPTRGTMYSPPEKSAAGPTTLNFGAVAPPPIQAGSHPPGYQQNLHAQEMSSAARASLDAQERRDGIGANLGLVGDGANDTANNVWNTVKGWAATAGNTLAETEEAVWKRINRDS